MSAGGCGGGGGGGGAALRAAAGAGDAAACARLLGAARCVRFSRDELGRSALHLACSAGHGAVVRLLLGVAAPREVDTPDGGGCTALQRAAADGHEEVLRLLLARGADVDKQDSVHGNSALHECAWKGYSRSVRLLAAAGAALDPCNAGGFTPLHLCCQNGHNQSCRELLLAGCRPDLQNNYGDTALHTAARYGHAGVTRILLSAQCRVSEQNKNGDTALHIAAAMGRRKLTRILIAAGCDRHARNKQAETARDIAARKDLLEILAILDECGARRDRKSGKAKKRSKSKVRFEPGQQGTTTTGGKQGTPSTTAAATTPADATDKPKHWSPYGCHYYPDPEAFPAPRLDSLPAEPLRRGEQYYLDLAGNIRKGPVGVGYTCYCAPLFRHLEQRLERDRRELQRAQARLGQRVAGLEQRLSRGAHARRSERAPVNHREQVDVEATLPRSRSLEMLDRMDRAPLQTTRSMDELDPPDAQDPRQRPSVKELVARIQQAGGSGGAAGGDSESSDDEDGPLRAGRRRGPMGDANLAPAPPPPPPAPPNYENLPGDAAPRSRSGVYSPGAAGLAAPDAGGRYEGGYVTYAAQQAGQVRSADRDLRYVDPGYRLNAYFDKEQYYEGGGGGGGKAADMSARFARMRLLDGGSAPGKPYEVRAGLEVGSRALDTGKMFESTARMLDTPQDTADRDTNNDSGYSTKVYGSSKGNSPSLSGGQAEQDCLGAASLV